MKRSLQFIALLALAALASYTTAQAADRATDSSIHSSTHTGQLSDREMIFRSDRLAKLDVFSRANRDQKLGSLDDLVVNAHTGKVLFGVLDTGVGGKRIPVPWTSLALAKGDNGKFWMTLDKSKDQVANAPTIEKGKNRPDFTDSKWLNTVDTFFGTKVSVGKIEQHGKGELSTNEMIFNSSGLSGLHVFNRQDNQQKLGSLDSLIVDAHRGEILYGILDTGMTGKNVVVPWAVLQLQESANNKFSLTLNKTKDDLKRAPTFDRDRIGQFADTGFRHNIDNFFGVHTTARPEQR